MSESDKDVNLAVSLSGEYSNQQNDGKREKIGNSLFFFPRSGISSWIKKNKLKKSFTKKSIFTNKGLVLEN